LLIYADLSPVAVEVDNFAHAIVVRPLRIGVALEYWYVDAIGFGVFVTWIVLLVVCRFKSGNDGSLN